MSLQDQLCLAPKMENRFFLLWFIFIVVYSFHLYSLYPFVFLYFIFISCSFISYVCSLFWFWFFIFRIHLFYFLNSFQKVKLISFLFLFCFLYTFFMTVLFPKFVLLGFTSLLSPPFHGCTSAKYVLPPTAVAQSNSLHHHPKLLFIKSTNQNLVHTWGHPLHWVVTRPQPDAGHLSPAARRARRVAAVPTATPKATLRSRRRGPLRTSPGADGSGGLGNGRWMPTGMRRPPQSVPLFRSAAVRGTHGHWIVGQGPMFGGRLDRI